MPTAAEVAQDKHRRPARCRCSCSCPRPRRCGPRCRAGRPADARDLAVGDLASTADAAAVGNREAVVTRQARDAAAALRTALGALAAPADGASAGRAADTASALAALDTVARWHVAGATTRAGLLDLATPGGDETDRAALLAAASAALTELDARLAARDAVPEPAAGAGSAGLLAAALARIQALLPGTPVLPPFTPADPVTLAASAARSPARTGGPATALGWLHAVGRAREQTGMMADAVDLAEAAGGPGFDPVLAQLPDLPGEGWAATTLPGASGPRTCLLALAWPAAEQLSGQVSGLVVDAWTEVIPDRRVTSGIAVHVDAPSAKAPQSCCSRSPRRREPGASTRCSPSSGRPWTGRGSERPAPSSSRGSARPAWRCTWATTSTPARRRPTVPECGGHVMTWQRLEGSGISADLRPGLAATVADPLWMLARQWQVGEFAGEDAASPVQIRAEVRWQPVGEVRVGGAPPEALDKDAAPLEARVECEGVTDGPARLRLAAESGRQLLRMAAAERPDPDLLTRLQANYPLTLPPTTVPIRGARPSWPCWRPAALTAPRWPLRCAQARRRTRA